MPRVLITGMSGTGKSSTLTELADRGHRTVDTDDEGWIIELDTPDGPEPVWHEDRVRALLDEHTDGVLFVAGCVANQARFYPRFDAVVLLSAPLDIMLARVAAWTNLFGSTPPSARRSPATSTSSSHYSAPERTSRSSPPSRSRAWRASWSASPASLPHSDRLTGTLTAPAVGRRQASPAAPRGLSQRTGTAAFRDPSSPRREPSRARPDATGGRAGAA